MLKRLVADAFLLPALPFVFACRVMTALGSATAFMGMGTLLSLVPGKTGSYLRVAYYRGTLTRMNWNTRIGFGTFFSKREATVDSGVFIGAYCIIGRAHLGRDVVIASRVSVMSGRHHHGSRESGSPKHIESMAGHIQVGDRTWIGEGAILMANVGPDCIVGAGAIVVKDVPGNSLAVGNPARALARPVSPEPRGGASDLQIG